MADPISLLLGGITGLAAKSMSGAGASATPTPAPAPSTAPPSTNAPEKPKAPTQQSFIGAAATPMNQSGQKTLLGQ